MKREITLIGGGGHCRACIDVIEKDGRYTIRGILDLPEHVGSTVLGYPIIGSDADLPRLCGSGEIFLITVGQIKSPDVRVRLHQQLQRLGAELPTIQSPSAHVSPHARIGAGTIVMHHAVVNAAARVGENCILNTGSLVEHDAAVGDHCHISTHAVINGGSVVEERTFIGSNSVLRDSITVGRDSVVGCGLRILGSLPPNSFVNS